MNFASSIAKIKAVDSKGDKEVLRFLIRSVEICSFVLVFLNEGKNGVEDFLLMTFSRLTVDYSQKNTGTENQSNHFPRKSHHPPMELVRIGKGHRSSLLSLRIWG